MSLFLGNIAALAVYEGDSGLLLGTLRRCFVNTQSRFCFTPNPSCIHKLNLEVFEAKNGELPPFLKDFVGNNQAGEANILNFALRNHTAAQTATLLIAVLPWEEPLPSLAEEATRCLIRRTGYIPGKSLQKVFDKIPVEHLPLAKSYIAATKNSTIFKMIIIDGMIMCFEKKILLAQ